MTYYVMLENVVLGMSWEIILYNIKLGNLIRCKTL